MKIHKHVSQKVIDANRQNAQHSHGPTRTRGKEAVRHNSLDARAVSPSTCV